MNYPNIKRRCKIGLVPLSVFSSTARKKAPYQFEGLIEPDEIVKLANKNKEGTITKNEEATLEKIFEYMGESYMNVKMSK